MQTAIIAFVLKDNKQQRYEKNKMLPNDLGEKCLGHSVANDIINCDSYAWVVV